MEEFTCKDGRKIIVSTSSLLRNEASLISGNMEDYEILPCTYEDFIFIDENFNPLRFYTKLFTYAYAYTNGGVIIKRRRRSPMEPPKNLRMFESVWKTHGDPLNEWEIFPTRKNLEILGNHTKEKLEILGGSLRSEFTKTIHGYADAINCIDMHKNIFPTRTEIVWLFNNFKYSVDMLNPYYDLMTQFDNIQNSDFSLLANVIEYKTIHQNLLRYTKYVDKASSDALDRYNDLDITYVRLSEHKVVIDDLLSKTKLKPSSLVT